MAIISLTAEMRWNWLKLLPYFCRHAVKRKEPPPIKGKRLFLFFLFFLRFPKVSNHGK
nr:MAG TPA: hypothetical protein [Caudoviricetes sp.]